MSNEQNSQMRAGQLQAQEAAKWNQAIAEGMRNAAPSPNWKSLADEALELAGAYKESARRWRGWAFAGFGYVAVDLVMKLWGMFR